MSVVTAEMKAALGRQVSQRTSYPVSASDIRRWAIAVYWPETPPRIFWDEAAAAASPHGGLVAPEDFNPFAWMSVGETKARAVGGADGSNPDRLEQSLGVQGPGLKFQLNGGLEVAYGVRMRPGDVVTATTRLAEYQEREGRLGQMLFTTTEDTWVNQAAEVIKRARMTLIRY